MKIDEVTSMAMTKCHTGYLIIINLIYYENNCFSGIIYYSYV